MMGCKRTHLLFLVFLVACYAVGEALYHHPTTNQQHRTDRVAHTTVVDHFHILNDQHHETRHHQEHKEQYHHLNNSLNNLVGNLSALWTKIDALQGFVSAHVNKTDSSNRTVTIADKNNGGSKSIAVTDKNWTNHGSTMSQRDASSTISTLENSSLLDLNRSHTLVKNISKRKTDNMSSVRSKRAREEIKDSPAVNHEMHGNFESSSMKAIEMDGVWASFANIINSIAGLKKITDDKSWNNNKAMVNILRNQPFVNESQDYKDTDLHSTKMICNELLKKIDSIILGHEHNDHSDESYSQEHEVLRMLVEAFARILDATWALKTLIDEKTDRKGGVTTAMTPSENERLIATYSLPETLFHPYHDYELNPFLTFFNWQVNSVLSGKPSLFFSQNTTTNSVGLNEKNETTNHTNKTRRSTQMDGKEALILKNINITNVPVSTEEQHEATTEAHKSNPDTVMKMISNTYSHKFEQKNETIHKNIHEQPGVTMSTLGSTQKIEKVHTHKSITHKTTRKENLETKISTKITEAGDHKPTSIYDSTSGVSESTLSEISPTTNGDLVKAKRAVNASIKTITSNSESPAKIEGSSAAVDLDSLKIKSFVESLESILEDVLETHNLKREMGNLFGLNEQNEETQTQNLHGNLDKREAVDGMEQAEATTTDNKSISVEETYGTDSTIEETEEIASISNKFTIIESQTETPSIQVDDPENATNDPNEQPDVEESRVSIGIAIPKHTIKSSTVDVHETIGVTADVHETIGVTADVHETIGVTDNIEKDLIIDYDKHVSDLVPKRLANTHGDLVVSRTDTKEDRKEKMVKQGKRLEGEDIADRFYDGGANAGYAVTVTVPSFFGLLILSLLCCFCLRTNGCCCRLFKEDGPDQTITM